MKTYPYLVIRGGAWDDDPRDARVADRGWSTPDDRYYDVGLRLVRSEP